MNNVSIISSAVNCHLLSLFSLSFGIGAGYSYIVSTLESIIA